MIQMSIISLTSLKSRSSRKKLAEKIRQLSVGKISDKKWECSQSLERKTEGSDVEIILTPFQDKPILFHQPQIIKDIDGRSIYKIEKFETASKGLGTKPSDIVIKSTKPPNRIKYKKIKKKSPTVIKIEEVLNKSKDVMLLPDPSEESVEIELWHKNKRDINYLPENVLQKIFFYFDMQERCMTLSLVCRSWYYILKNPIYWTKLEFTNDKVPPSVIIKIIRHSPMLRTLKLIKVPDFAMILQQLCRCNNGIKELAVRNSDIFGQNNVRVILQVVSRCSSLESVDLRGTQFKSKRFFVDLGLLKNLKSLNLSSNKYVTSQDLMTLSINCRTLKELKLLDRPIEKKIFRRLTDDNASFIISNWKGSLTTLKLDMKQLGTPTFQVIFNCPNLTNLTLTNCLLLNGETFRKIKQLRNLKKLKLTRAIDLNPDDFSDVFNGRNLNQVEFLDLSGCWKIGERGLRSATENLPLLKSLCLKSCKSIDGTCLAHLARCSRLSSLNLAHTSVQPADLVYLADYSIHLKSLTIDRDMSDFASFQELKILFPKLKITLSLSEYVKNEELISFAF